MSMLRKHSLSNPLGVGAQAPTSPNKKVSMTMNNPFDDPKILNSDVIDKLTDEQVATILEMFNKAGY